MAATPRKRVKPSTAGSATPLVKAFTRLRSTLHYIAQLSSATTGSPAELQNEVDTLVERINVYQAALAATMDEDVARGVAWKDELDSAGTLLWSRSTAYKHAHLDAEDEKDWLAVVAGLRLAAYRLIRLGALEPPSRKDHLSHLSLATKAAIALLNAHRILPVEPLLLESAKLVAALEQDSATGDASPTERAKGLLAYFCFRMRFSLATDKISLVHWSIGKAKDLLKTNELPWRDVERLVQTLLDVVSALLRQGDSSSADIDDADTNNEMARDWLQWALDLLDHADGQDVRSLQVAALKLFARACIIGKPSEEYSAKAEEALKQILDIEPSPSLYRRVVNLVITRNGSDAEIKSAFLDAAKSAATSESDGALKRLRLELLADIVAELSTWGIAQSVFLAQVIVAAVWLAAETDKATLTRLLETVQQGLPNFRLSAVEAFSSVSWLRRFGDTASLDKRHADAAEWYLLATSSVFRSLPPESTAKTIRKAALSFLYAEKHDRVEEVMRLVPSGSEQAKDYFMRFCARQHDVPKAIATLKVMVTAPGFSPSLLQWAHKLAAEHGNEEVKKAVLELLLELSQTTPGLSFIRQHVAILQDKDKSDELRLELSQNILYQLEAGLALARRLRNSDDPPASLGKEIAWMYKTSFNLCAEFCALWSTTLATRFFGVTAALIELSGEVGGESGDANKLWTCKMAVVAGKYALAKETGGKDKKNVYKALLQDVDAFLDSLNAPLADSPQLAKAEQLLEVALAAKVDGLVQLADWKGLVALVETFEDDMPAAPLSIVKLVVDVVTKSVACPLEDVHTVLRKTLALLYSRQDLDVPSMALWLRMLVFALVDRRDMEQAFEYVQNAQQFIEQHQDEYPEDEASWMLTTAWDEGLNAYAASSLLAGAAWCGAGLAIARAAGSPLADHLETQLEELKDRYAVKEEDEDEVLV
ncbi:sporulation-specific protein 22 [Rhodotorula kratochvilovae]